MTDVLFTKMSGQNIPPLPPQKPIRLESRFSDLQATFMGRILYNAVLGVARKRMKGKPGWLGMNARYRLCWLITGIIFLSGDQSPLQSPYQSPWGD